jgi:hypothetical protein
LQALLVNKETPPVMDPFDEHFGSDAVLFKTPFEVQLRNQTAVIGRSVLFTQVTTVSAESTRAA